MLQLIQRSTWNAWDYLLTDATGQALGEVVRSRTPQATNARLQQVDPAEAIAAEIRLPEGCYRIRYEILRRGFTNAHAWWLLDPTDRCLARIEQHAGERAPKQHRIVLPQPGCLRIDGGRFSPMRARIVDSSGHTRLRIGEPGWFSWKRTLHIDGDVADPATGAFFAIYLLTCLTG